MTILLMTAFITLQSYAGLFGKNNTAPINTTTSANVDSNQFSQINLLFLISASNGVITPSSNGTYLLTLQNVSPYITYFSDRPARLRGIVPTLRFIQTWATGKNNFRENNPNGIIVPMKINEILNTAQQSIVVSFANPKYSISKNIMQFTIRPLISKSFLSKQTNLDYVAIIINS